MAGRDSMAMPGASSYYIQQRNIAGPAAGTPTGAQGPTVIRPLSNPSPSLPIQTSLAGGGTIGSYSQVETSSLVAHSGNAGGSGGEAMKRKRGRPRKYGPDGTVSLALSPVSSATPGSGSSSPGQKRGRGRPPGTGRKQQLAALGEWVAGSAGMGFTPHVITIPVGEDIATKIMSFSQQGPRAVCILSANGAVSTVTLRQPATSGGTVTYEGRFEILCLSGSYLLSDDGGSRSRSGGLSISLSSPDGRVIGGGVGGMLIAATPVQVIVGSFIYGGTKAKNKTNTGQESGPEPELPMNDRQSTPSSALGNQNLTASSVMGGWPVSRQLDMRSPHIDINLTRG